METWVTGGNVISELVPSSVQVQWKRCLFLRDLEEREMAMYIWMGQAVPGVMDSQGERVKSLLG